MSSSYHDKRDGMPPIGGCKQKKSGYNKQPFSPQNPGHDKMKNNHEPNHNCGSKPKPKPGPGPCDELKYKCPPKDDCGCVDKKNSCNTPNTFPSDCCVQSLLDSMRAIKETISALGSPTLTVNVLITTTTGNQYTIPFSLNNLSSIILTCDTLIFQDEAISLNSVVKIQIMSGILMDSRFRDLLLQKLKSITDCSYNPYLAMALDDCNCSKGKKCNCSCSNKLQNYIECNICDLEYVTYPGETTTILSIEDIESTSVVNNVTLSTNSVSVINQANIVTSSTNVTSNLVTDDVQVVEDVVIDGASITVVNNVGFTTTNVISAVSSNPVNVVNSLALSSASVVGDMSLQTQTITPIASFSTIPVVSSVTQSNANVTDITNITTIGVVGSILPTLGNAVSSISPFTDAVINNINVTTDAVLSTIATFGGSQVPDFNDIQPLNGVLSGLTTQNNITNPLLTTLPVMNTGADIAGTLTVTFTNAPITMATYNTSLVALLNDIITQINLSLTTIPVSLVNVASLVDPVLFTSSTLVGINNNPIYLDNNQFNVFPNTDSFLTSISASNLANSIFGGYSTANSIAVLSTITFNSLDIVSSIVANTIPVVSGLLPTVASYVQTITNTTQVVVNTITSNEVSIVTSIYPTNSQSVQNIIVAPLNVAVDASMTMVDMISNVNATTVSINSLNPSTSITNVINGVQQSTILLDAISDVTYTTITEVSSFNNNTPVLNNALLQSGSTMVLSNASISQDYTSVVSDIYGNYITVLSPTSEYIDATCAFAGNGLLVVNDTSGDILIYSVCKIESAEVD